MAFLSIAYIWIYIYMYIYIYIYINSLWDSWDPCLSYSFDWPEWELFDGSRTATVFWVGDSLTARSREVSKQRDSSLRLFLSLRNLTRTSAAALPRCLSISVRHDHYNIQSRGFDDFFHIIQIISCPVHVAWKDHVCYQSATINIVSDCWHD